MVSLHRFDGISERRATALCPVRSGWTGLFGSERGTEFPRRLVTGDTSQMGTLEFAVVGLAGSGIGAAMGLPMLWSGARHAAGARLLGGWLLAVSAIVALISARVMGLLPGAAPVEHAINLIGLMSFPFTFLYIRRQTHPAAPAGRQLWLWLPAVAYATVLITRAAVDTSTRVPFQWMLPVLLFFTAACARLVARRESPRDTGLIPSSWLVGFLVVLNAAQVVRMLFGHVPPVPALVPFVITVEFVMLVSLVALRATTARMGGEVVVSQLTEASIAPSQSRYERSNIDESVGRALLAKVEQALTDRRLFADASLTLAKLSTAAGSTPHQVSEALNRYGNVTFHELLNRLRVADVKAQLQDPASDGYTIEGIGASAGFGSRSALYSAFRKLEGMTPAEFRARRSDRQSAGRTL